MRKLLLTLFLSLTSAVLFGQQSISGKIIDEESGEALIGATVIVKGTSNGAITDLDGSFTVSVPSSDATLVISYIGYESIELSDHSQERTESGEVLRDREIGNCAKFIRVWRSTIPRDDKTCKLDLLSQLKFFAR